MSQLAKIIGIISDGELRDDLYSLPMTSACSDVQLIEETQRGGL